MGSFFLHTLSWSYIKLKSCVLLQILQFFRFTAKKMKLDSCANVDVAMLDVKRHVCKTTFLCLVSPAEIAVRHARNHHECPCRIGKSHPIGMLVLI